MLQRDIREFISEKKWKSFDDLMNAALEWEQEIKKIDRSSPKWKADYSGPSVKKQRIGSGS